jgi:hypothetical protein
MGDFALPSFDFGGVGDDLDISHSDVRHGSGGGRKGRTKAKARAEKRKKKDKKKKKRGGDLADDMGWDFPF